jgi:hypothetical protein
MAKKTGSFVFSSKISFSTHFLLKTPRKHTKDLVKPKHGYQKANKSSQNLKSTRNKNSSQAQSCCFRCFQGKQTLKCNPLHHMEHFDTKINRFGGQNLPQ